MLYVILFQASSVMFVHPLPTLSFVDRLRLSLMLPVSLVISLVIFLLFVLANMMIRPELFPAMKPSALLHMVLICLNRKRRKMIEKACCLFKGLCSHIFHGCSVCAGFSRHFAQTVVQILKGGDTTAKP